MAFVEFSHRILKLLHYTCCEVLMNTDLTLVNHSVHYLVYTDWTLCKVYTLTSHLHENKESSHVF